MPAETVFHSVSSNNTHISSQLIENVGGLGNRISNWFGGSRQPYGGPGGYRVRHEVNQRNAIYYGGNQSMFQNHFDWSNNYLGR